jgi:SAM-dependent methyltransferase
MAPAEPASDPLLDSIRASYDTVADEYATRLLDELAGKPIDRALLDCFAELTRGRGRVLDVGCGPGQIARYLHDRGVTVDGLDLSPQMVARAAASHPGIRFAIGDLFALPVESGSCAGIAAFYAIVNTPPARLPAICRELHRVLAPDGLLLLSFHLGAEQVHLEDWWGHQVAIDFWFFGREEVEAHLRDAGLAIEMRLEREPHPGGEHPTRRAYLLARRPA